MAQVDKPFACRIGALDRAERDEMSGILATLFEASPMTRELEDGFELTFSTSRDLFPMVAKWIYCESRCCPFFEFRIDLSSDSGPMNVKLSGPPGVKEFILEELPGLRKLFEASAA